MRVEKNASSHSPFTKTSTPIGTRRLPASSARGPDQPENGGNRITNAAPASGKLKLLDSEFAATWTTRMETTILEKLWLKAPKNGVHRKA